MNYDKMSVHELVIATYYADRKDLDNIEPILRKACIREASVGVGTVEAPEDTEVYAKMVKMMVYWKGRYELAVRGMADKAAIEIMGCEP